MIPNILKPPPIYQSLYLTTVARKQEGDEEGNAMMHHDLNDVPT